MSKVQEGVEEIWQNTTKNVEPLPGNIVRIDLVGPYTVTNQKGNNRILNDMTFMDLTTGWFDMAETPNKVSVRISQIFKNTFF